MNTTITYGPVVDLQPPHVVGGQQTFAVVGDQGIRQTTGRNAHAVVAVWGRVSEKIFPSVLYVALKEDNIVGPTMATQS